MHIDADTPATEPDTTPTDLTTDALSALDAGIAAADADEAPAEDAAPAEVAPPADATTPPADDPNAAPPADAQPPAQPEGAPPADVQAPAAADAQPQPDAETEAEIASLGLKDKTAERFRTLASEVKELAPIRDALKAAGIEDVAKLPDVVKRAEAGDFLFDEISKTGTSPEQYGMALDYLTLIAKAGQGDTTAGEQAWQYMSKEIAVLAKMLGKEVPGVHDPLANHKDLAAEVEAGDLPRARAIEIAGQRDRSAYTDNVQRHQDDTRKAMTQAQQDAFAGLQAYDAEMKSTDPSYLAKREILHAHVNEIMANYPPREWERRTAIAYAGISLPAAPAAAPVAPAQPATPRPGPLRPSGPRPAMAPQAFDNPMDALNFGIEEANQG